MRIYELAKELGAPSKDLIKTLAGLNIEVKNHMSSISDDAIAKLRAAHGQAAPASAKPTTPVAEPVAAAEASAPVGEPVGPV
jgi:translation initiation factor IF-2